MAATGWKIEITLILWERTGLPKVPGSLCLESFRKSNFYGGASLARARARFTQFLLYKLTHSGCSSDFFAGNGHVSPFLPPSFFHTMGNSLMSVSLAAQETGQMKLYPRRRRLQLQNNGGLSLYASVHRSLITLNT